MAPALDRLVRIASGSFGCLSLCTHNFREPDLADAALDAFCGPRVAYVGEWATGMTATRSFHESL
eukprot:5643418-Pleurochrysis_carterae.AAC.1